MTTEDIDRQLKHFHDQIKAIEYGQDYMSQRDYIDVDNYKRQIKILNAQRAELEGKEA